MSRRAALLPVVGALVLGTVLAGAWVDAAPSQADPVSAPITAVGWWSRQPVASPQPAGGFQVAYGVDGAESVAAIRVSVPTAGSLRASLALAESSSSVAASRAAMQVCTTTGSWAPANPGAFQQAPPANCTRAVPLTRNGSAAQWTADVSALLSPGTANLMIVPVSQPVAAQVDPGYTVTITKAAISADGTVAPATSVVPAGSATAGPGIPGSISSPAFVASGVPVMSAAPPPPSGSSLIAPAAPTPSAAAPPSSVPTTAPTAASQSIAAPMFHVHVFHHGKPWWRLALFIPLAALSGVGAAAMRRAKLTGAPAAR